MTEETATIENASAPIALEAGELRMIAPAELHESPLNPRKYFAEGPLAELAASIKAGGVRVPLVARPRLEGGGHEIAAGHRRYRAAKMAGLAVVPVIVREMSDAAFLEVLTFDNHQREDMNALEEAEGFQIYIEEAVADVAAVAAKIGKSGSYVYGRLKLLEAAPEAQRAFYDGRIKAAHLELLARIPEHRDQKLALRAIEPPEWDSDRGPMSIRDLKAWIAKNLQLDLAVAPFSRLDVDLVPEAGACGPCPDRLGNAQDFDPAEDIAEMCTRGECYRRKVAAHVEREKARLGDSVVLVSQLGNSKIPGVLIPSDFSRVPAGAFGAKDALVVEGPDVGRIIPVRVQERLVPPPPKAPAESSAPKPKLSKEEKARIDEQKRQVAEDRRKAEERQQKEREEREKKLEAEKALRLKILDAVLAKVKWPPRPEDLAGLMTQAAIDDVPEALDDAIHMQGIEPLAMRHAVYEAMTPERLARLTVLIAVCGDFEEYAFGHGAEKLDALAKRYGVDPRKMRAEAEGGTRKEVVTKPPAATKKPAPVKKAAAKKASGKKALAKKGGKK